MADNAPFSNRRHGSNASRMADAFVGRDNALQDRVDLQQAGNVGASRHRQIWGDAASIPEDKDPSRLCSILEDALDALSTLSMREEEEKNRQEMLKRTWEQVRHWLWSNPDRQDRAEAACIRGQAGATPLHLMCKLGDPPSEAISDLVAAAPKTASWIDSMGWLPLHYACDQIASPEVLKILSDAFPDGKNVQDKQNRTPLHLYVTRKSDNPGDMATSVAVLSDTGASEFKDGKGWLPMHYACVYGAYPQVLKVLAEACPDCFFAKDEYGRTPMHLVMANAHQDGSAGVMRFFLESGNLSTVETVNTRDLRGYLPLHLLALGLKRKRAEKLEQRKNVSECLSIYLAANPAAPADFLAALQDLPNWLQDVAVVSPHVRSILNKKIVQRFPTSILMLDGYFLAALIVCFEITTRNHIDILFEPDTKDHSQGLLVVLFLGGTYFLLRELVQVSSLISLGNLSSWFCDTTNWLDCAVIFVVFYFTTLMAVGTTLVSSETFRTGVAYSKGILWCAVINYLKNTLVDFAVFVGGVFYVLQRLAAFTLAACVILVAFAQMFFFLYVRSPICTPFTVDMAKNLTVCQFPHCTFPRSLLKVYTMMLGEIGDETRYSTDLASQIVYVAYAFLVVILLSNVLIAIVTDSYEIIQNDRAAIVFWSNRLSFVAEMDAISYGIRSRLRCFGGGPDDLIKNVQEIPAGDGIVVSNDDVVRDAWDYLMFDFSDDANDLKKPSLMEALSHHCFRLAAVTLVIPIWLIAGAVTAGWFWPPQVREYLFEQKDTAISRADLERSKLEQLQKIRGRIKSLKSEIRKELAWEQGDVIRLKGEVEMVHGEVLSDLRQVKDLMATLVDMGNNLGR